MNIRKLFVLFMIVALLAPTAAATPPAGPCMPGAAYDPACDADQDGTITVTDIQLTAGHWNQSGTFVSDNNHDHLGQTWTGAGTPLKIEGEVGSPDYAPLLLSNSATNGAGIRVLSAAGTGVVVDSAGYNGVHISDATYDGLYVNSAGSSGVSVLSAAGDGVFVCATGTATGCSPVAYNNGIEIGNAQHDGVHVTSAGIAGVYVQTAGATGVYVNSAGNQGVAVNQVSLDGMTVNSAGRYGMAVFSANDIGVRAAGNNYAGYFYGNVYVTGLCTGCRQAHFGVNAGDRALEPGDVVSVQAVAPVDFDTGPILWQVGPAQAGQAAVGVVAGKAELVIEKDHRPGETGRRLVPRAGAAQPGDYVTIVYSGPMQVKVAPGAGAITAGSRLTAAADGVVRPLGTLQVQLADGAGTATMSEDAPVLGVALEAPQDGMVWVLVTLK